MFWQGLGAFPWPCYIFDLLIATICDAHTRVLKCKMQGLGKHCVLAGFGGFPMTMLHFRSVDPRDLRCAYACAKM